MIFDVRVTLAYFSLDHWRLSNVSGNHSFSRGDAVILHTALISSHTLGGVLALSTWLLLLATFPKALLVDDKKLFSYSEFARQDMTEPVIIPASDKHTATIIFLHGLDDVGKTWLDEFNTFDIPKSIPYVKFIFPTASIIKISKNNGELMTSWFDVYGFDQNAKEDQESIEQASRLLNSFVDEEIKNGISSERIIIGGFSMGGAVALHTALTSPYTLGGVLALSTWLPLLATFPNALVAGDKKMNLPILHCHGNKDPIIQINWARLSEESFKVMGFKQYIFKEYDGMDHTNSEQEMKDVIAFIEQHLPKQD